MEFLWLNQSLYILNYNTNTLLNFKWRITFEKISLHRVYLLVWYRKKSFNICRLPSVPSPGPVSPIASGPVSPCSPSPFPGTSQTVQDTGALRPLLAHSVSAFVLFGMISGKGREVFSCWCHWQKQDGSPGNETHWHLRKSCGWLPMELCAQTGCTSRLRGQGWGGMWEQVPDTAGAQQPRGDTWNVGVSQRPLPPR